MMNLFLAECHLIEPLTPRESEVLALLADGLSDKEIGNALSIAPITVRGDHKQNIYDKLGLEPGYRDRKWAVHCAQQLGLLTGVDENEEETLPGDNPYKGLGVFQTDDANVFFGREAFIEQLLHRLGGNGAVPRFLAIVGPSGSGKSSVVRAGLIPALGQDNIPGSSEWTTAMMTPHINPFHELETVLQAIAVKKQSDLLDLLQRDAYGLSRVARLILPESRPLLLIVDQFEELFTLVEDQTQARQFIDVLYAAVTDPRSTVRVVITLRADFLDRPLMHPDFSWLVQTQTEMVIPLTPDELERTITLPAEQAHVTVEPGLVAKLVAEANEQPGALPLLQFALTELYDHRIGNNITLETYDEIGGLQQILAAQADRVLDSFDAGQQEATRQLFLHLITLGEGTEDVRRRVSIRDLESLDIPTEAMHYVTQFLAANRLLTLDVDPATGAPSVEVAHEALIREWGQLGTWLDESRNDVRMERLLAGAATEWQRHSNDESYLMRGARLSQFEGWREITDLALTDLENKFLDASIAERDRRLRQRRLLRNAAVVVVIIVAVAMGVLALTATNARHRAEEERNNARIIALVAGSQAAVANNDTDTAIALAWQAVSLNPDSALAQVQLSEVAYSPGTVRLFQGHTAGVDVVAISPDEQRMLSASWDGTLIYRDIDTDKVLRTYEGHTDQIWAVDLSPDGRYAASGGADTTVIIWDVDTGKIIQQLHDFEKEVVWVEFHPDGQSVMASGKGPNAPLIQWDVQTGAIIRRFEGHSTGVETIRFTPDGGRILSGGEDGTLILWDVQTGDIIYEVNPNQSNSAGSFRHAIISPDGQMALVGYSNSDMFLLDMATGEILQSYSIDVGGIWSLAFHPDKDVALVGGITGTLAVVDLQTGNMLQSFSGFGGIFDTKVIRDGRFAITASVDSTLRMVDLSGGQVIRRFAEPSAQLFEADLSPDGRTAVAGTTDGTVTFWDVSTREIIDQFVLDQPVMAVKFSPDGQIAVIGTGYHIAQKIEEGHIILWDVAAGQEIRRFEGQPYAVFDVEFNRDGTKIVSSGNGAIVILWDIETGEEVWRFEDYWVDDPNATTSFKDVEFSPDGTTILAAYGSGPVMILNAQDGEEIGQLVRHEASVVGIAFSKNGQKVVTGGLDQQAILWDMQTRNIIRRFANHAGAIGQVRFSPDERFILGGSSDGTNLLWNVDTGEVVRSYRDSHVQIPIFSPAGTQALVGFRNGAVELWRIDATLDELLEWTQANRYIPELTCQQRDLYRVEPFCDPDS